MELQSIALPTELLNHNVKIMAVSTGIEPAISCVTGRRVNRYETKLCNCGRRIRTTDLRVMSPTSYRTAPSRDNDINGGGRGIRTPRAVKLLSVFKTDPFSQTWVFLQKYTIIILLNCFKMAEEEGFEPPRAVKPLSVFKTDPFSRTWVFLQNYMDLAGFEPATERL